MEHIFLILSFFNAKNGKKADPLSYLTSLFKVQSLDNDLKDRDSLIDQKISNVMIPSYF